VRRLLKEDGPAQESKSWVLSPSPIEKLMGLFLFPLFSHIEVSDIGPGDKVSCKISKNLILLNYADKYEMIEIFEVVCPVSQGYLVKVPTRTFLKTSFEATPSKVKEHGMPKNFTDAIVHFMTDEHVVSVVSKKDGEICQRCKDFFPMASKDAEGNFKCFNCRTYRHR
jgi:hypothetical protein